MKKPTPADLQPVKERPSSDGGEIPVIRWSNRRKMAWRAFWALLIYTPFYWMILPLWFHYWALPTAWLTIIGDSYFWFATTMAAVIISYMGFTSLPFWGGRGSLGARPSKEEKDEVYDQEY